MFPIFSPFTASHSDAVSSLGSVTLGSSVKGFWVFRQLCWELQPENSGVEKDKLSTTCVLLYCGSWEIIKGFHSGGMPSPNFTSKNKPTKPQPTRFASDFREKQADLATLAVNKVEPLPPPPLHYCVLHRDRLCLSKATSVMNGPESKHCTQAVLMGVVVS
ncbi:hypothetical protein AMECASPLE_036186 [Ameca splendens]|uniref:Uncharacterized protein n=1 Tax=Ameca splendens TaxID=208324 RepID=A0ABV0XKM4_9TELE